MSVPVQVLQSKTPIYYLDSYYQLILAKSAHITQHRKGDLLFNANDTNSSMAFLIWGEVSLTANDGRIKVFNHTDESSVFVISKLQPKIFTAAVTIADTYIAWVQRHLLKVCMETQLHLKQKLPPAYNDNTQITYSEKRFQQKPGCRF